MAFKSHHHHTRTSSATPTTTKRYDLKPKSSFWSGTPAYTERLPLQPEHISKLLDQLLNVGSSGLQNMNYQFEGAPLLQQTLANLGSNKFDFEPIANREVQRFQQDIIPTLAERFSAMGSGGSQRSSAFQGALGQAGSDLSQGLAALGSQYGLQQRGQQQDLLRSLLGSQLGLQELNQRGLGSLLSSGLQPRFEGVYNQAQPGFKHALAGGIGQGTGYIGNMLANLFSGGAYGAAGNMFSGRGY